MVTVAASHFSCTSCTASRCRRPIDGGLNLSAGWPILQAMNVNSTSSSAAALEAQREIIVMKKQQDVTKEVGQALVELVKDTPAAAPGRIDTYA
jgi:hypothetical protein